eukprot:COSAG06_NODE_10831_length_1609_cov_31.150331_1_plen_285_part_00
MLAFGFGGGQSHIDHSCLAKENEGKRRGHPGLQPRRDELNDTRGRGSCDTDVLSLKPSKYVELAPGVFALRPDAGLVNLGVPAGTNAYVTATVEESVRKHDARLRKLVELALHATDATKSCGRNLGRMSARLGLRYSALARNIHFLRSVPERLGKSGAEMHDRGVMSAFAAAYQHRMGGFALLDRGRYVKLPTQDGWYVASTTDSNWIRTRARRHNRRQTGSRRVANEPSRHFGAWGGRQCGGQARAHGDTQPGSIAVVCNGAQLWVWKCQNGRCCFRSRAGWT